MKEREVFLDKLRVAATCAVVLLHTVTGVMDTTDMSLYPAEKKVFLVILDLVCWSVPVFLLISGYLFLDPERKISSGQILTKYCRRVAAALFLFGVPYACLEQLAVQRRFRWGMVGEAFRMVLRGESWSHMWYLYLILFLYLATPFLRWALARVPRMAVYMLLAVLVTGSGILPFVYRLFGLKEAVRLPDEGIYLFYYLCGWLFAIRKAEDRGEADKKTMAGKILPPAALILTLGMACSRIFGYTLQMAYNYPFTTVLSLVLFGWGASRREAGKRADLWGKAAALSFAVYLIHPVFLNMAYKFFHVTPLSYPLGLSLPLFFGGAMLLSWTGAWLLRKLPPLTRYVL